jgi:hypothetical protein
MGSTEVQRTLVKSPPELWAELSDPAALARHLGELGEIRITRLEPGEKVEWEATDTSGTVVLKPSGWGTKVTLTATSDAPTSADQDAEAPDPAIPQPAAAAVCEPAANEPVADREPAANEPAANSEPAANEPADTPRGPAIEAWRELAAAASAETGFPLGPQPAAASPGPETASPGPVSAPPARVPAPARSPERTARGEADAPSPAPEQASGRESKPPPVQCEPRRGFFARLFRRRPVVQPAPPPSDGVSSGPPPLMPTDVGAAKRPAPEPTGEAAAERPAPEPTRGAAEGPPPTTPSDGVGRELSSTHAEMPAAEVLSARGEPAEPPQAPAPAADAGPASPPEPSSAEETIDEGIASDRVTAVLTATLDRLGAAHHRPFSRA